MDDAHLGDEVADGVRARDPDALAASYVALADPLYRYLLSRGADPTLAEDLVEATFLELIEYGPRLRGGGEAVRAWLFRAARNNLLDEVRKVRRRADEPLDDARAGRRSDPDPGPETRTLAADRDAVVRSALAQLSPDQQEVLRLRFAAGLSGPEVAALTGRTVGAVKALQHRGLAALARRLGEDPRWTEELLAPEEGPA